MLTGPDGVFMVDNVHINNMIHMANQIALYFAAYPHETAVAGVADHIQKFWEKKMRQQLQAYITGSGAGLHALVLEAAKTLS